MSNFQSVKKFMVTFGQEVKNKAEFPNEKITKLRYDLIKEELEELGQAIKNKDLKEVADALTDLAYVLFGSVLEFGLQDKFETFFEEVQRSNMSKLDENGQPIKRADGKILKGPNFFLPDLKGILEQ